MPVFFFAGFLVVFGLCGAAKIRFNASSNGIGSIGVGFSLFGILAMSTQPFQRPAIPPLHEYWKRPILKDKGDDVPDIIFRNVGMALSTWEWIETAFAKMFGLFVEGESIAAERVYGTIIANPGKQEILRHAVEIFAERQKTEFPMRDFNLLLNHFKEGSSVRNEIAHGIVQSFTINDDQRGFFLTPAPHNSRKTEAITPAWLIKYAQQQPASPFKIFGYDYRYTSTDIENFSMLFKELSKQASGFLMERVLVKAGTKFEQAPDNQKATIRFGEPPKDQPQS